MSAEPSLKSGEKADVAAIRLRARSGLMQCIKEDRLSDHLAGSDDLLEHRLETPSAGWTLLRRPDINLSHGATWKTLISRYISVIPFIGDELCIAAQGMSG
jgi:hypothetical protein